MDSFCIISNSEQETMEFAKKFAKHINNGDTVILEGELGAGKTKFVEGFLKYYNLEDEISSPTFNIINEYILGKTNIYHFDVYRLEDIDEFYAVGGEEYFNKGICLIEWGEQIKEALPLDYIHITFKRNEIDQDKREIIIKAIGKKYKNILDKIKGEIN